MSEAITGRTENAPKLEFLRQDPMFEHVTAASELLDESVFGSYQEADQQTRLLIEQLDEMAAEAGLIGEGVELISEELKVPATQVDPASGTIMYAWGQPDENTFDGRISRFGRFAGFTHVIKALTVKNGDETLVMPAYHSEICYQLVSASAVNYPHVLGGVPAVFAPARGSELIFSSDREKEQASEALERLMKVEDPHTTAMVGYVNRRLSGPDRYSLTVLRGVGERMRQQLKELGDGGGYDADIERLTDDLASLIKARLRVGAAAVLTVQATQSLMTSPDQEPDAVMGETSVQGEVLDVSFMPYFYKCGTKGLYMDESGRFNMPCLVFQPKLSSEGKDRTYFVPLEKLTSVQLCA